MTERKAIRTYEDALGYITFKNEDQRYLIVGNLLVNYNENNYFQIELCHTVKENELTGYSKQHFDNYRTIAEEGVKCNVKNDNTISFFSSIETNKRGLYTNGFGFGRENLK
jgi:hypothetical protein